MDAFGVDHNLRLKIVAGIAVLSYSLVSILNTTIIPALNDYLPFGLSIPVTFGIIFTILFELFNRYVWRWSVIPSWIVAVPDLNGHWEGHIWSDYNGEIDENLIDAAKNDDNDHTAISASLNIKQTWRKISVYFETGRSPSNSTGASFNTKDFRYTRLAYQFQNEGPGPREMAEDEGQYSGAAEFKYKPGNPDALEGFYFTGPSRGGTSGAAAFERVRER